MGLRLVFLSRVGRVCVVTEIQKYGTVYNTSDGPYIKSRKKVDHFKVSNKFRVYFRVKEVFTKGLRGLS